MSSPGHNQIARPGPPFTWGYPAIALTVAVSTGWSIAAGARQFVVTYWPDDAFFYKVVARNIVHGLGSTADGIGLTNGYHPLWMLVHIALEWMFDDTLVPQLLLQALLLIVALFLLFDYVAALTNRPIALALCLVAASEQTFLRVLSSGMETHLAFIGLLLVLRLTQRRPWQTMMVRERVALSAALTLLFFSRLDGGMMWVTFSLLLLAGWLGDKESMVRRAKFLFDVFRVPASFALAYLVANQLWFGSAMPVSGRLKSVPLGQLADPSNLRSGLDRLAGLYGIDTLSSIQALGGTVPRITVQAIYFILTVSVLIGIVHLVRRRAGDASLRLLLFYAAVHTAYYVALQGDTFSMQWAKGPEVLLMSVGLSGLFFDLVNRLAPGRHVRALTVPSLVCLMLISISYNGFKARKLELVRDFSVGTADFWAAVDYIRNHVPSDAVIASHSIGFVGYFSDHRVFSVDGLLNSTEYYRDYVRRNRKLDYMIARGVRYSIDAIPVAEDPLDYLCAHYYPGLDRRNVRLLAMFHKAGNSMGVRNYALFELSF